MLAIPDLFRRLPHELLEILQSFTHQFDLAFDPLVVETQTHQDVRQGDKRIAGGVEIVAQTKARKDVRGLIATRGGAHRNRATVWVNVEEGALVHQGPVNSTCNTMSQHLLSAIVIECEMKKDIA